MTAAPILEPGPGPDPRTFVYLHANQLRVDERKQRDIDPEKVARIQNEWDWNRVEVLTVAPTKKPDVYDITEGQHRGLAAVGLDPRMLVPCMVLAQGTGDREQAQIALDITTGRRGHSALDRWKLAFNAGHKHEVKATQVLTHHGLRVGKAPSATTISAVATVRRIIHGGQFSPDYGATLLHNVIEIIKTAFPTHDHNSNVSRWDRWMLLAVAFILQNHPDIEQDRLVRSIQARPATQWINFGKGADTPTPDEAIRAGIISEYNRGRRRGRI